MCGLTGFYEIKGEQGRQKSLGIARTMNDAIAARGPDGSGFWQDEEAPLTLAHRRLAIIDLSEEGAQPMLSSTGRYTLVYNGEIYNFLELRTQLEAMGVAFRGRSDTEVLLAAIESWGLNLTLQKISGMYAIVLWDKKERILHFIRDRLGKKPLYIGWAGTGSKRTLVFGSELKALRAHPDFKPEINKAGLALFMRYGYIPAPQTIYQDVSTLLPGHWLSLGMNKIKGDEDLETLMKPYWNLMTVASEGQDHLRSYSSEEELIQSFEHLLMECTRERMISDVPLGAFLSGGIDSSTIVALMQRLAPKPVKTYTIGFKETGFNEAEYAAKVARHLGTEHHELMLDPQAALDVIPNLPTFYDEPFADISAIPTYLVSKFARSDVTVALSGDGGDEMLGGYNRHIQGPRIWDKLRFVPQALRGPLGKTLLGIGEGTWDRLLPFIPQAGGRVHKAAESLKYRDPFAMYHSWLSRWENPEDIVAELESLPLTPLTDPAQHPPPEFGFAQSMMAQDALSYLPNDILVKVDRASMAVGLEARAPLLDRRVFDFVWSLPVEMKIRGGEGKWLLRQVLAKHVPPDLFERPKQGFSIPVATWLRGPLRGWAEDLLEAKELESDGLIKAVPIHKIWAEHLEGRGNHAEKLWSVLMFQSWKKKWL
ncbi:MAG: asparagine synthase (glutamine-hydrolyzing) [Alphaproteobacteria bacterium]|nr:asparagine synthase (glutamine-hydrolyzing) [Alphaproteobacteria bacterium]MCD8570994.1 asparagine synthase (glutamine-hydrolyzing) [Alphaproteobacteria bacterium]